MVAQNLISAAYACSVALRCWWVHPTKFACMCRIIYTKTGCMCLFREQKNRFTHCCCCWCTRTHTFGLEVLAKITEQDVDKAQALIGCRAGKRTSKRRR
ncbi:hypothetical protein O9929_27600 [Vibrio lentus]|nr:hypothetical protein [Vibrio lentus]